MVQSLTLGFIHSAIVGQSEDFQKAKKKKKTINMVHFLFER